MWNTPSQRSWALVNQHSWALVNMWNTPSQRSWALVNQHSWALVNMWNTPSQRSWALVNMWNTPSQRSWALVDMWNTPSQRSWALVNCDSLRLLRGVGQNDPPLSTVTSACDCWEPPPPPSSVFAVTDHYAVATWETCLVTIGFSTVTSASGCWEGWVKLTHPSQQPQLRLVSPWSGRVHNAHQCQPCLSFERLTSTLFEMRNSVSIKIGKKQSINQSINQIWIKPSISRFLKFAVYCRGLLDPKVSNQSCGGMQAAQCNVLKNATQSHAMTLTFYLALISGSRFRGPLPYLLSWWRIMATRRGRKRNRPQAEGWRPQWSIERLQSRSNATLPPIASWMRQFASFFCLLWLRCTIEIDDGSRKWKERSKYELED